MSGHSRRLLGSTDLIAPFIYLSLFSPFPGASVKSDEEEFIKVLESRAKNGEGKLKIVDVAKQEKEVEVKELITMSKIMEGLKVCKESSKWKGTSVNMEQSVPTCKLFSLSLELEGPSEVESLRKLMENSYYANIYEIINASMLC